MSAISTAVGNERLSRVSGYKINKGIFTNETPNLPQMIAIFGEANTANQTDLTVDKREITSAKEAGEIYGYGSPIHRIMSILRPVNGGDGVGGIPTVVFPQITDEAATATEIEWTVTGTATANATHYVVINGRDTINFQMISFSVVTGDTATIIAGKIKDAINACLGAPVTAANTLGVMTATTKWKGVTSTELDMAIDYGDNSAGLTYAISDTTLGAGSVDLADSLALFANDWYTCVINPYGTTIPATLATFEAFNGVPASIPTGRWSATVFKPFMAFFGSVLSSRSSLTTITDANARVEQVTNVLCPAPASKGFTWEAAANVVALFARQMQDNPHLDINNLSYPDMPVPSDGNIGDMADYNNRDLLVKVGCSTVILENGAYKVMDLVTTYHPDGETPLQFSYCRNLNLDWNVKDAYTTLETIRLRDKTLVRDNQNVTVTGAIKPREWKAVVFDLFEDLAEKALINDPQFSKDSLQVQVSPTNPNRFETRFRYKRTGIARIESTDAEAGF
jgi:phage tail sheath gpL-like